MKKIFFSLLAIASIQAEPAALVAKILPSDTDGYFILADGTYWKVTAFATRWRSPLEWIMGDEVFVPQNYQCTVKDWSFGDEFDAYPKFGNLRVNEADASNEADLKKHSHILINPRTEKILFGTPIHPADFMTSVYNEGYQEGRAKGYSEGYNTGYAIGKAHGERQLDRENR